MLLVGTTQLEDKICARREVGWFQHGILCTWQLFLVGFKQACFALDGPFLTLLVQETASPDRQFSVRRSICCLESPDHRKPANEWVWLRL